MSKHVIIDKSYIKIEDDVIFIYINRLSNYFLFFPIILTLGFDPIWFGVIVVMVVELGLITPPVGMNMFVIKGIVRDVELKTIYVGVLPFCVAQLLLIAILMAFPLIATWLPGTMG